MTLALEDKKRKVEETRVSAEAAVSALVADFRGVTVAELTNMRKQAREAGVQLQVVRNTLARLAFDGTAHECLQASLKGPSIIAFSNTDPGAGARLVRAIKQSGVALDVRAISIGGTLKLGEELDKVASLPTRDEALARLMSVIQGPVAKLAQVLDAVPTKLVRTLAAVRQSLQSDE